VTAVRTGEIRLPALDPSSATNMKTGALFVVVSADGLHSLPISMAIVVPLTGTDRHLVTQPRLAGPATGLSRPSFVRPEDTRALDTSRLVRRLGTASAEDLATLRKVLRYFLDL
jgi:mRNA interferase MazF